MNRRPSDPRGAQDFSSTQIRVRGTEDFKRFTNERLRLPNDRGPFGPRLRRLFGAVLALALIAGLGFGVYYGAAQLLEEDEPAATETSQAQASGDDSAESEPATSQAAPATSEARDAAREPANGTEEPATSTDSSNEAQSQAQAELAQTDQQQQSEPPAVSVNADTEAEPSRVAASEPQTPSASVEPTVSADLVTPAQIGGAEILAERVTAEAIPAGIPRSLADGAAYDPTDASTAFTSRWPVGTSLRLTRLLGATLLTDEQQAEIVDSEVLVVVRASEASNSDLQLSPAAFDLVGFYGTERIIAVRVEVTAPPP